MPPRVGDLVTAIRDGGHDPQGYPRERPLRGRVYRIKDIYMMSYGLGCELHGLNPWPYRGYFLFHKSKGKLGGWYFERLEKADEEFIKLLRSISA